VLKEMFSELLVKMVQLSVPAVHTSHSGGLPSCRTTAGL